MPAKDNFYIALYEEEAEVLSFPYFVDEFDDTPGPQKLGKGLTEYVLRTGAPLLASPDVFVELEKQGEVESIGSPSIDWLGVPLRIKRKPSVCWWFRSYTEGFRYSEDEQDILWYSSPNRSPMPYSDTDAKRLCARVRNSIVRSRNTLPTASSSSMTTTT